MSSILKALKKIEESAPNEPGPGQAVAFEPQSVFRSRLREKKTAARGLAYGAAAVGLVLAAVLVLRFLPQDPPPAGGPPTAATAGPAAGGMKEIRGKIPAQAPSPSPPAPVADPDPGLGRTSGEPGPGAVQQPAPPPLDARAPAIAKPMRARRSETAAAPAKEERPFLVRKEATPTESPSAARAAPAKTAEDGFDRLDESKLKVMAIAWSQDPNRRIAVINGRIIKEGESVDGYSVTRIRKDDIIVGDGSKSWRVVFTLKTQP